MPKSARKGPVRTCKILHMHIYHVVVGDKKFFLSKCTVKIKINIISGTHFLGCRSSLICTGLLRLLNPLVLSCH